MSSAALLAEIFAVFFEWQAMVRSSSFLAEQFIMSRCSIRHDDPVGVLKKFRLRLGRCHDHPFFGEDQVNRKSSPNSRQ